MIEIYNVVFASQEQLKAIANGMREPMNSQKYSDTPGVEIPQRQFGQADYILAKKLASAGENNRSHTKYLRQTPIMMTIKAPMYWWAEYDTYHFHVRNSSSKMHTMMKKPFELSDFSIDSELPEGQMHDGQVVFQDVVTTLNYLRDLYLKEEDPIKKNAIWRYVLQLLPESYNQSAFITTNYEELHKIYVDRCNHKLSEWHTFCDFIEQNVLMSDLIVPQKSITVEPPHSNGGNPTV